MHSFCALRKNAHANEKSMWNIGSSKDIKFRLSQHKSDLKKDRHFSTHLQNSYNKYGKSNFKFNEIMICEEKDLLENEIYYIKLFNSIQKELGYNQSIPTISQASHSFSKETKRKMASIAKIRNGNYKIFDR